MDSDGLPGGIWGGLGAAIAAAGMVFYRWFRKQPDPRQEHWAELINSKLDKLTESTSAILIGINRQCEIAQEQKETTTKIWEKMLTRFGDKE